MEIIFQNNKFQGCERTVIPPGYPPWTRLECPVSQPDGGRKQPNCPRGFTLANPVSRFNPGYQVAKWKPGQSGNQAGRSTQRVKFEEAFTEAPSRAGSPEEVPLPRRTSPPMFRRCSCCWPTPMARPFAALKSAARREFVSERLRRSIRTLTGAISYHEKAKAQY
jgi:hypothetical protein